MSSPQAAATCGDLSPDGTRIAFLQFLGQSPAGSQIRVIALDNQSSQEIVVKGWDNLQSVDWAADGKTLYVSGATAEGSALLHVDMQGNARVLWERRGSKEPWFALASALGCAFAGRPPSGDL
jgi:Tol biopolymer transport system component